IQDTDRKGLRRLRRHSRQELLAHSYASHPRTAAALGALPTCMGASWRSPALSAHVSRRPQLAARIGDGHSSLSVLRLYLSVRMVVVPQHPARDFRVFALCAHSPECRVSPERLLVAGRKRSRRSALYL